MDAEEILDRDDAGNDIPAVLQHLAVIGGDIRLAFRDVDDHGIDVLVGRDIQLDGGRKTRAAESYQTRFAHRRDQLRYIIDLGRLDVGRYSLFAVALDEDRVEAIAVGHGDFIDFFDRAGYARVDGRRYKGVTSRNTLTDVDGIAGLDQRHARRADMLTHRQGDHLRHRQFYAFFMCGMLVMRSMNPSPRGVGLFRKAQLIHNKFPLYLRII